MYFKNNKDNILNDFEILRTKTDCIINFFSLDLVKEIGFSQAIYALYPDSYNQIFYSILNGNFKEGNILPFSKSKPIIMHIPYKKTYNEDINKELLKKGLIKFSQNYKKLKIEKISVQKNNLINEEILNEIIEDLDFPDIMYFEQNSGAFSLALAAS